MLCCSFILFLFSALSFAQRVTGEDEDLFELSLEELGRVKIGISATHSETLLNSVSVVSVIDSQQIVDYGYQSLDDALSTIPGFDVLRTYFIKSVPVSRGILPDHYANKILFMINGIPSWGAVWGDPLLWRIDINDVERIEVLKGAASVLYGTNAYSGAINIQLKTNEGIEIHLGGGNNNAKNAGMRYSSLFKNGSVNLYLNSRHSQEQTYQFTDESGRKEGINDFIHSDNLTINLNYLQHEFQGNYYDGEEGYFGIVPLFSSGAGIPHQKSGWLLDYKWRYQLTDTQRLIVEATSDYNNRIAPSGENSSVVIIADGHRNQYSLSYFLDVNAFSFEAGVALDNRTVDFNHFENGYTGAVTSDVIIANKEVKESSFYSQLSHQGLHSNWVIGGRFVDNELFGSDFSLRGSYVYLLDKSSSIKFIAGESFRSPSLFETYAFVFSGNIQGNLKLEPEEASTFEISWVKSSGAFLIQTTAYHAEYTNKIFRALKENFVGDDGTVFPITNVYENGGDFAADGIEIEFKYHNKIGTRYFGNLSYTIGSDGDELDNSGHHNFKYVPKVTMSAGVSKKISRWTLTGKTNYRGSSEGPMKKIGSSIQVDLGAKTTQIINHMEFTHQFSISNVFDDDFVIAEYVRRRGINEIPVNFGRSFSYSIKVNF
jgi:outer membrane receptor protein involved in Fe transport